MKTIETKYVKEFHSGDVNGDFIFRVQKDGSQLTIVSENGCSEVYVNVNKAELQEISKVINSVIETMP